MKESISVAIPVFNRADWIRATLDHIFAQTIPVEEVVICDDGSTDRLENSVSGYDGRVKVVRIENSGPAVARKTAVELCKGEWIALCDSDDFWQSNHIENFLEARASLPEIDLYFSNFKTTDRPEITKLEQAPSGWFEKLTGESWPNTNSFFKCSDPLLGSLLKFQACFQSCMVFKRDLYWEVGGICPRVSRWASEDWHLTARMAAVANASVGTEATVLINKHSENFSAEYVRNLEGERWILTDICNEDLVPQESISLIKRTLGDHALRLFRAYYWSGEYDKARQLAKILPKNQFGYRDWLRLMKAFIADPN